jgi:hypothetical protein
MKRRAQEPNTARCSNPDAADMDADHGVAVRLDPAAPRRVPLGRPIIQVPIAKAAIHRREVDLDRRTGRGDRLPAHFYFGGVAGPPRAKARW